MLGVEHLHDLVARYRRPGRPTKLDVSGAPVPLLGGLDILAYRIVEEVLGAAGEMAPPPPSACDSARTTSAWISSWPGRSSTGRHLDTRAKVQRFGGSISRTDMGTGERITVELPLAPAMAGQ